MYNRGRGNYFFASTYISKKDNTKQVSDQKYQNTSMKCQVSDIKYQISSMRFKVKDIDNQISSIRCQVKDTYSISIMKYIVIYQL